MRASMRVGLLALILCGVATIDASAAVGWLEKLSGPGPFKGPQYAFTIACYGWPETSSAEKQRAGGDATQPSGESPRPLPFWRCGELDPNQMRVDFGVDVARLSTNENPLVYTGLGGQAKPGVNAFLLVPYASVTVAIGLDVGVGFGIVRFTDRNSTTIDFSATKLVAQPIRVTIKPLAPFFDSTRWDAFQLAFNGTLILQAVEDRDFGAVPGTFREPTELLWQTELRIDVGQLVFGGKDRSRRRR